MNVIIPKEKIIYFNILYVYFLEDKKVYRGKRKGNRSKTLSAREHNTNMPVWKNSIKEVKRFAGNVQQGCTLKTAKILKRHGVEMYS